MSPTNGENRTGEADSQAAALSFSSAGSEFSIGTHTTESQFNARIENLVAVIRQIKAGAYKGEWDERVSWDILPDEYTGLLQALESDQSLVEYFHHKLQFEYAASNEGDGQFTIFPNSIFHDTIVRNVNRHVRKWMDALGDEIGSDPENQAYFDRITELRKSVKAFRATTIEFDQERFHVDISYGDRPWQYPPLVIDVSLSREPNDQKEKARRLIRKGGGEIRTVVGLDLFNTYTACRNIETRLDVPNTLRQERVRGFKFCAVFNDESGEVMRDQDGQMTIEETHYIFLTEDMEPDNEEPLCLDLGDFLPTHVLGKESIQIRRCIGEHQLVIHKGHMDDFYARSWPLQNQLDERSNPPPPFVGYYHFLNPNAEDY
ncbi:hypothetical protein SAMD00023353_5200960 [Rosellinia necatrix]|uniref:Uncharacterized protein n=1 Tax=Rosellinia necatrix TaxID=77044 RepID=A0A1W2TQN5_ROSNE|nr:hypothetical protein SAMD00023353_5200960 [Rosellinia necatrix]